MIDGIEFILCTLWAKILPENFFITENSVSDFMYIAYNGKLMTSSVFNQAHQKSAKFLTSACKTKKTHKRIIVTHHVPTALCMADEFKTSRINGAFVAELHDFIYDNDIDYWIYGHSHRNMPEIDINGTILLCNQLGYVGSKEHLNFNPKAFFEIK
jgi:UDP-2,3-diacylglucosamine pyrophosphatase LpxH